MSNIKQDAKQLAEKLMVFQGQNLCPELTAFYQPLRSMGMYGFKAGNLSSEVVGTILSCKDCEVPVNEMEAALKAFALQYETELCDRIEFLEHGSRTHFLR